MLEDTVNKKCRLWLDSHKYPENRSLKYIAAYSAWLHTGVVNEEYRGHGYFKRYERVICKRTE